MVNFSDPAVVASITATLSTVMLVAVQAGLGCTVTVHDLRDNMRRPLAVGVGLFAQVVGMPAIAYALASALRMEGDGLLGLALVACTPGGSMSNVFSYYARGSMALSITLTVLSNLLAFGSMPLAIYVLAPQSAVPFSEIVKTLALTIVPTAFGIALKTYAPRVALWGEKLGAGIGGVAVVGAIVSGIAGNAEQLPLLPAELFISTSLLGVLGMLGAWLLAVACRIKGNRRCARRPRTPRRRPRARRAHPPAARLPTLARSVTLCIETGVQNLALTMALIALSFQNKFSIVVYSYVFGFVICIECALFAALARWRVLRTPLCGVDPSELEQPMVLPMVSTASYAGGKDGLGLARAESAGPAHPTDDAAFEARGLEGAAGAGGGRGRFSAWVGRGTSAVAART